VSRIAGQLGYDVADMSLAAAGVARVEWAERSMPVLRRIGQRFAEQRPFDGVRIAACMHVTAETANLLRVLRAGGAQVALCASNPLSTQDDTAAALVEAYGVAVYARNGVDATAYAAHVTAALDIAPQLVLDDGCDLVTALHAGRTELLDAVVGGCEDTTTGALRLRQMSRAGALRFPVVTVDDTDTKRMFDNRYGTGQSALDAVMRATNTLLAGRTVVVAGYGWCGKGVAERARGMGAHVVVTEVDPVKALDASLQGYHVLPMAAAAPLGDVFLTVTGNRDVIRGEHLSVMKDGAVLANAGHFDVEIDVQALRGAAVEVRRQVRPHTDEYVLADGRRMLLLAEGRLVNLAAGEGVPAAVMDLSFAVQALCAEWLLTREDALPAGVQEVPPEIGTEVARLELAATGVSIDVMTPEQERYLIAWD